MVSNVPAKLEAKPRRRVEGTRVSRPSGRTAVCSSEVVEQPRVSFMKVIKSGEWKKKIVCRGCNATLEIVADDIEHEQVPQDDESFAEQFFVTCPECSHKIILRNIPPKVQEKVLLA
jgi:uncharacterized protein with PIN domain